MYHGNRGVVETSHARAAGPHPTFHTRRRRFFEWAVFLIYASDMGKHGPKPKSPKIKAMEGNPGKRKLVPEASEVDIYEGKTAIPNGLRKDERQIWRELTTAFPSWYFRPADQHLMIAYCRVMGRYNRAELSLRRKPMVTKRGTGGEATSQYIRIMEQAETQLMKLSERLAITRDKRLGLATDPERVPTSAGRDEKPWFDDQEGEFGDLIALPVKDPVRT